MKPFMMQTRKNGYCMALAAVVAGVILGQTSFAEATSPRFSASWALSAGATKIAAPVKGGGAKEDVEMNMAADPGRPWLGWFSGGRARLSAVLHDGARSLNSVVPAGPLSIRERQGSIPARDEAVLAGLEAHMDVLRLTAILADADGLAADQKRIAGKVSPRLDGRRKAVRAMLAEARGRYRRISSDAPEAGRITPPLHAMPYSRDQALELALRASPAWNAARDAAPSAGVGENFLDPTLGFSTKAPPHTRLSRARDGLGFSGMIAVKVGFQPVGTSTANEALLAPEPIMDSMKVKRRVQKVIFDRVNVAYDAISAADLQEPALSYHEQRSRQDMGRAASQGGDRYLQASDRAFETTAALTNMRYGRDFARCQVLAATGSLVDTLFQGNGRDLKPALAQAN